VRGNSGVTEVEISSRLRTRAVVRARHELWWRIRADPERYFSYPEIARLFACDHSSVRHGIQAHERSILP
jgi:chromosomal replication initiation ATPase DnaA